MKHLFCRRHSVLEGDVKSLEREKLDPNRLNFAAAPPAVIGRFGTRNADRKFWETSAYCRWCYRLQIGVK